MTKYLTFFLTVWVGLMLSACGGVHNTVTKLPEGFEVVKVATIAPIEVISKEQNPDALALNAQWKKMAGEELQSLLANKKIATAKNAQAIIVCRINAVYGNRALRWVAFGAGAGSVEVKIELQDKDGNVRYATASKADLSMGVFGGDMSKVAREAIQTAVKEFGSRL